MTPKRATPRSTTTPDKAADKSAAVSEISALLAERQKYEEWIAALEAKKEQTPAHVFTRVHADYEQRLKAATDKLAAHSGSLGGERSRLEKRIEELDLQIRHRQDERSEIELRAHVGEMTGDEVTEAYRVADDGLAKLNASRSTLAADLAKVTELIGAVASGKPPAQPAATPQPPAQPRSAPDAPKPKSGPGFDELSFLQSVVGEEERAAAAAALTPKEPPKRESVAATPAPRVSMPVEKAAEIKPAKEEPPAPAKPAPSAAPAATKTVEKPAAAAGPKDPMLFDPKTAAGVKSLKCKACGAMNNPTEWYCEKCGAEVSIV